MLLARVTCPNCQNQFQTPIEQILDVKADPAAKLRVMNGLVNVAVCPHCQTRGALNLPFLYHDPDKQLALVYMPMEAGQDNLERQKVIGRFTTAAMNSLPPEAPRGYLLQPQVFLTMENLTKKILEADGVTPEMIEEQRAKAELMERMIEATSDEALEAMIKANNDSIDAAFLRMLSLNLEIAQSMGQADEVRRLLALLDKLLELSRAGQAAKARSEMLEALRTDPTREKLLELLTQATDERTRELLVTLGRPMLDYLFFQSLTSQIEAASDEDERKRLKALRTEILEIRDRLDEQARALHKERSDLLRDLLLSDDPEKLARSRLAELDQGFFNVLTANMEQAQAAEDAETAAALQGIWSLALRLLEETLPPELRLFNRLMTAEDEAEVEELLQENQELVTQELVEYMEEAEAGLREEGAEETAEHLASVLQKARAMI
jgi:hypothetical protein